MKKLLLAFCLIASSTMLYAQSRSDVFDKKTEITWLGIDFTQLHFIGEASQWKDIGAISNSEIRDKYFVSWNELFHAEKSKYDVAGATHRKSVKYATNVSAAANSKSDETHFGYTSEEFRHLSKEQVEGILKAYDYKKNAGVGMMFIVEGMSKSAKKTSLWVAFVDMSSKEVLLTKRVEAQAGGFGFRNYWAKSFYLVLKSMRANFKSWE